MSNQISINSVLYEPIYVKSIYEEYFKLINYYHNIDRMGIFVKYFNLNVHESTYDEKTISTYDNYSYSHLEFDVYDLTPVFMISQVTNRSSMTSDLSGTMMDGETTIVTYTLERPRIHDLISFYEPIKSDEIFRVTNISTPVNAIHSNNAVNWYELELQYAPVEDITTLRNNKSYVYDLAKQQYLKKDDYIKNIKLLDDIKNILIELNKFYNIRYDCYVAENKIPLIVNDIIIKLKQKYSKDYNKVFENTKYPFGYLVFKNFDNDINLINYSNNTLLNYKYIDLNNKQIYDYKYYDISSYNNDFEYLISLGLKLYHLMSTSNLL